LTVLEAERQTLVQEGDGRLSANQVLRGELKAWFFNRDPIKVIENWKQRQGKCNIMTERVMLISATNGVMEQKAETRRWIATVAANRDGQYVGGFVQKQFLRNGPMQEFCMATEMDPYPYFPYFRPSDPLVDPTAIFTPAERRFMIRSFITDPLSDIRHPDGAIDPRQGGADMNPQELKTEGVILDLLPLNSMHVSEHLVRKWIAPWHTMMYSFLRRAFRRKVINDVLNNFGPQVASYFKFLDYYTLCS